MSFRAYMIEHPDGWRRIETVESTAKRIAKHGSGTYRQIEIPSNKGELVEWINLSCLASQIPELVHTPDIAALMDDSPAPERVKLTGRSARLTALEETIQTADGFELARLVSNVISRLEELRREAGLTG